MSVSGHFLNYTEAMKALQKNPVRLAEIPIEHAMSLMIPTMRWGEPAFAFFASPATRRPGQPTRLESPDRWGVLSAAGGHIIVYAKMHAYAFSDDAPWPELELPTPAGTVADLRQGLLNIAVSMNALIPHYFSGACSDPEQRTTLLEWLRRHLDPALLAQHESLAPDFFSWLLAA